MPLQRKFKMVSKDELSTMVSNSIDSLVVPIASRWGMVGGTLTSGLGWLISAQGVAVIGLVVTVGGFIVNYIFQHRKEKREKELHDLLKAEVEHRIKATINGKQKNSVC